MNMVLWICRHSLFWIC